MATPAARATYDPNPHPLRHIFTRGPAQGPGVSGGATFENYNRGKRGVVLDLKTDAGMAAFRGLLADTDVFVTNVRRQSLESLGIEYEQIHADFPKLIYAHVTGWGRSDTSNTGTVEAENEAAFDIGSFVSQVQQIPLHLLPKPQRSCVRSTLGPAWPWHCDSGRTPP